MFLSVEVLGEAVSEAGMYNQSRYFLPDGIVNVYMLYISTCNLKSYKPFFLLGHHVGYKVLLLGSVMLVPSFKKLILERWVSPLRLG